MPKGQTPKMHGSTVPVHVSETCNQLLREGACEEFILVKFKKKLSFNPLQAGVAYLHPLKISENLNPILLKTQT